MPTNITSQVFFLSSGHMSLFRGLHSLNLAAREQTYGQNLNLLWYAAPLGLSWRPRVSSLSSEGNLNPTLKIGPGPCQAPIGVWVTAT